MLPRNPIARDTAELPSSSSPSSSAKTRPSSRKHKPSKENDPPSDHNIIVPYSPSHLKSKSPLPPRPPSSNPLKRKLALDTIAAENSLPATTDSGVKVIVRMRSLRKDKDEGDPIVQKISGDSIGKVASDGGVVHRNRRQKWCPGGGDRKTEAGRGHDSESFVLISFFFLPGLD
ncbi:hypothetical protein KIW84_046239 [Lathyrus oleraceus]|uniref:Uncharacterized protein n=1 Tax=Pisum sativum TaxID=3888 RepID=A0A9D5AYE3_PEA|nr:hypothetical protein KIW84_046239 [Pisum sativum]